ncbi:MAG: hypothetical protein ACOY3I_09090 [Verrucomicrobiota bacterium]
MPHWVTINGNHVLLDDDGRGLNDPEYDDDDDFDPEELGILGKEGLDALFRETAEAMNQGVSLREYRAEKLGIDPEELDALEQVSSDFQKMTAEEILKKIYASWFKNQKGPINWNALPTKIALMLQYLQGQESNDNLQYDETTRSLMINGTEVRVSQRGKKVVGISIRLTGNQPNFNLPYVVIPANTFFGIKISERGIEVETNKPLIGPLGAETSHITFNPDGTIRDLDTKGMLPLGIGEQRIREKFKKEIEKAFKQLIIKIPEFLHALEEVE